MKLSYIWLLTESGELSDKTCDWLMKNAGEMGPAELLIYTDDGGAKSLYENRLSQYDMTWSERKNRTDTECYNDAFGLISGDFVTAIESGDRFSGAGIKTLLELFEQHPKVSVFMAQKQMPGGEIGAFANPGKEQKSGVVYLDRDFTSYPFYFGGTFVRADYCKKYTFREEYALEAEREFFLRLDMKKMHLVFCRELVYESARSREGDYTFFRDIYERAWYRESFENFWIPYLTEYKKKHGSIPMFVQYHAMFTIYNRFSSNWNNRNKHVIPEGEEPNTLEAIARTIQLLDNPAVYNVAKIPWCTMTDSLKWIYGVLKNGQGFHYDKYYLSGAAYYGTDNILFNRIVNLKTNIVFMNYESGVLHVDGMVHAVLFAMADEVYLRFNGKKYPLEYNERYTLNKAFGVSLYKGHSFHVKLPMQGVQSAALFCAAMVGGEEIRIAFSYESHFSRLSRTFKSSYWCFGNSPMYLCVKEDEGIRIRVASKRDKRRQERTLAFDMLRSFKKRAWVFWAIRRVYFMVRPFMKRKPVWMYLDKIYKGGDSAEYLYRYASAQDNNFRHYYLIDKKSTDYRRLKKDGYRPLVRGSVKHRLVFLMADMMVISNSTVFAFNNFGLPNSSYVRDLVDFHVCCVQHGMSVQKIAVAQNRLRDNTRLYFCASKYEIENLSRPIYDYVGYDALKLTGVPRYDGLVDDDKKQIMISPTWRMQAAVPVRTSEGEQRDYNPLFRESTYFKVFNALINDSRLIEAAKKYGYRIKYVLHPIVSAQVDDFDKNDFVDVIPAVGDMSYEKMFCESSLMVTDFSGIQFDFAYMRKPLVYLHHRDIPQHYEEGTFFYDTMAFGEIAHDNDELIDLLCEYMANGCKMKEEYVRRADDFFYYNDRNNCKRIYDVMVEYQKEHVFNQA